MYTLPVDFGTTFTAAAVLGEDGVPAMVGLGNRAMQVPSTVFVALDGSVLVGEAADRRHWRTRAGSAGRSNAASATTSPSSWVDRHCPSAISPGG